MPADELAIIDRYFRPLAGEGAFGLFDDAARFDVPAAADLVVTVDMIANSVHFLPGDPPDMVAQKALRVNLSDLAAKGAKPLAYVLSLGLPRDLDESWLEGFAAGLRRDQEAYDIALLGGDTIDVPGGPVISLTAFGAAPKGGMVHRFGGRAGDVLMVSGTIGAGAAGLALLKGEPGPWDALTADERGALINRYRVPQPRTALAPALVEHASAALDVSDGLVGDLDKLAAASGCSAVLEAARVPLPQGLAEVADEALLGRLITSGDDYEILAALPEKNVDAFGAAAEAAGVALARVGRLVVGAAPPQVLQEGRAMTLGRRAYVHGRSTDSPA